MVDLVDGHSGERVSDGKDPDSYKVGANGVIYLFVSVPGTLVALESTNVLDDGH